ncbi:MAG: hypothetical protein AAFV49_18555 [Pseudomonadota bacterium]
MTSKTTEVSSYSPRLGLSSVIKASIAPHVMVVRDGDDAEFLREVVKSKAKGLDIVADRTVANTTAFVSNDEFVKVPRLQQGKSPNEVLGSVLTGSDGPPVAMPYSIIRNFMTRRVKKVCDEMDMVAHYPVPKELALKCAIHELRDLVQSIATRGRRPLVLHDLAGIFVPSPGARATVFASPTSDGEPMLGTPDDAVFPFELEIKPEEVELDLVVAHADFVADVESFVLQRMCPTVRQATFRPLLSYWQAQFARLDDVEEGPLMRRRAEKALRAAFDT